MAGQRGETDRFTVTAYVGHKRVVLGTTNDGLEAEVISHDWRVKRRFRDYTSCSIEGVDPSHAWPATLKHDSRCGRCGAPNNGCYSSHLPCGFDLTGVCLLDLIDRWKAEHEAAPIGGSG